MRTVHIESSFGSSNRICKQILLYKPKIIKIDPGNLMFNIIIIIIIESLEYIEYMCDLRS